MLESRIRQQFEESAQLKLRAAELLAEPLAQAIGAIANALSNGGKILACGNGGSAADAQHFSAELVGRFERERPEHRGVVGDSNRRPPAETRDHRRERRDDHAGLPAEQDDRRDGEDEAERDPAGVDSLDGDGEALGERHSDEKRGEPHQGAERRSRHHVVGHGENNGGGPRQ